jgi:hypothetical protein
LLDSWAMLRHGTSIIGLRVKTFLEAETDP